MFEPDPDAFSTAERVPVWTRPVESRFTATDGGTPGGFAAWADTPDADTAAEPAQPVLEIEAQLAQAHADGIAEGRRIAEAELAEERLMLGQLAQSLEALTPEPPQALAALLAATVRRLVTQVVGEVEIDHATLDGRAGSVAAVIAEEAGPSRLRLHPADAALLGDAALSIRIVTDATLARGTILVETGAGWIEDSTAMRLERLHAALDRMGLAR